MEVVKDSSKNEEWRKYVNADLEEQIFISEIKENEENYEKCQQAKKLELENFDKFNVYIEVEDCGQPTIGSRLVLSEKEDGKIKARFVIKGFQEHDVQADSLMASQVTLKLICSLSANENWRIEGSDVSSAFLQSKPMEREVFVDPPREQKREGFIWRLIKPAYGLNDASRYWYETLNGTLIDLGMTQSHRDSCLFYYKPENNLEGLILIHVDDILSSGSQMFKSNIITKLRTNYKFGKVSENNFIYTGIHMFQNEKN